MPFINKVTHVEFSGPPKNPEATVRNAVVIPPGAIDRFACGTGTSAKMALLAAKGQLAEGESFVHESIIGSLFHCGSWSKRSGRHPGHCAGVAGSAYVTGIHTFFIDPEDLPGRFSLG